MGARIVTIFVFIAGANSWDPIQRYASTERVASYVRLVFAALEQPFKPRFSKWKVRSDSPLLSESGVLFWSGHSMRHFIPSVAAAINIPKDQRDYVGRWHVNFHQSADYVHTFKTDCGASPGTRQQVVVRRWSCL